MKKTNQFLHPGVDLNRDYPPTDNRFRPSPEHPTGTTRKKPFVHRIHLPILFPLIILFSLLLTSVRAQETIRSVRIETFDWCNNAWNASKPAESPDEEQRFEGNVYRARRSVKMASSTEAGTIRVQLPAGSAETEKISLFVRGARYDKSKPSRLAAQLTEAETVLYSDTLHFSSYYKDGGDEPYRNNDSMTQVGLDFSSCDTLVWAIPAELRERTYTLRLSAAANDQCFLDEYRIWYHDSGNPVKCDTPYNPRTSVHFQNPNWLRLYWSETYACQNSDRFICIDSSSNAIARILHKAGEIAQYDLKYLHPAGRYQLRIGRICPPADTVYSEQHDFVFPEITVPAVRFRPEKLVFEGYTGTAFQDTLYLRGYHLEAPIRLVCRGNSTHFATDPARIEASQATENEFPVKVLFTMERSSSPYNHYIEILYGPQEQLLDRIPVEIRNTDDSKPVLRVIRPGVNEFYREGEVEFIFETGNFTPGEDGYIAIEMLDSIVYCPNLLYTPLQQEAGRYSPTFYLTDMDKKALSEERIQRIYVVEASGEPDPDPNPEECKAPDEMEILDITTHSAYLTWTNPSSARAFSVRIRTLFETVLEIRTDINELFLESLEPETLYLVDIASVCAEADTSDYSEIFRFRTEKTVGIARPAELFSVYPNPSGGTFHLSVPGSGKIEIRTIGGTEILSETVAPGIRSIRLSESGVYLIRYTATTGNWSTTRKIVVR